MSADATSHVFRHSPFRGATFSVHHAIADVVNDLHNNEFWMSAANLSKKARVSERACRVALHELEQAGCIELIESPRGKPNRYRFCFPDLPAVYEARGAASAGVPLQPVPNTPATSAATQAQGVQPVQAIPNKRTETEPKSEPKPADSFAAAWSAYPRKTDKGAAKRRWVEVTRKADPLVVLEGVRRFATDPNLPELQFVPHFSTWLHHGRWEDGPLPPRANGHTKEGGTMRALSGFLQGGSNGTDRHSSSVGAIGSGVSRGDS